MSLEDGAGVAAAEESPIGRLFYIMMARMKLDRLRWILPPVAAITLLVMLFKGATPGRFALCSICALAWYGLSHRKARSLDRDRLNGGSLGRR